MDLFKRTLVPVENVLKEAKLQKDDIHEVLLVGGSTRIPKIQQLLKDYFRGKEPRRGIQPDEAVAYGMAVQGRMEPEEGCTYIIMDIAPLSLGLETAGGAMTVMIPRNTLLPTKKVRTFSTYQDDQDLVTIKVYEGERARVKDNHLLGTFELSGLPPAPQGTMEIEVTFEVDENGILTVTAEDKRNNNKRAVSFTEEKGRLEEEEMVRMIQEAEEMAEEDEAWKVKLNDQGIKDKLVGSSKSREGGVLFEVEMPPPHDLI
eukprot:TRINITY_DN6375_c0_g1_i3.p1 TRINITY_DN6375_c0_g1~~TRINITY_DN6375_c0_g1_i3.p1  ORF type:complete len:260 (+),score=69.78 TRINITY_DN6375_c0_g1_i3:410-1189(+)